MYKRDRKRYFSSTYPFWLTSRHLDRRHSVMLSAIPSVSRSRLTCGGGNKYHMADTPKWEGKEQIFKQTP